MELSRHTLLVIEWLGLLSMATFIGSLLAVPWIIARLPAKYFIQHREKVEERHQRHPLLAKMIFLTRNAIGFAFLMAGAAMLVLPGQGVITMIIGLSFMDFPKKHQVVDFLVHRRRVRRFLNWMRRKEKKPPFQF
ncbi:MAG: PGPGW domain-containing protein [Desulfobulbaceae bacterium]